MIDYSCYNIRYNKHVVEDWVTVTGEIRNETSKNFNTAVFKITLYVGTEPLGSALIKLRGFRSKSSKAFDVIVEGVHYELMHKITKHEIMFESAY